MQISNFWIFGRLRSAAAYLLPKTIDIMCCSNCLKLTKADHVSSRMNIEEPDIVKVSCLTYVRNVATKNILFLKEDY